MRSEQNQLPPLPSPMNTKQSEPAGATAGSPSSENRSTVSNTRKAKGSGKKAKHTKTAGRFAVLNEFVDCSLEGLTKAELVTWFVLYRDTRNGTARTSQTDIARRAGIATRSVQRAIGKLQKRGLLKCVHRGGLNKGPSRYRVLPATNGRKKPP